MTTPHSYDTIVIGAGIVGTMAAWYLQREGRSVCLLEWQEVAHGASQGNAGILAFPEIAPMAAPGVWKKVPRWLSDPLGPLSIRPAYLPQIAPWLWKFWRASAPQAYARSLAAQTQLMALAQREMGQWLQSEELGTHFQHTGTLDLFDSEASLLAASKDFALRKQAGYAFERVGRAQIEALQPGLAPRFAHGFFTEAGTQVRDPKRLTQAVAALARQQGAGWMQGQVAAIRPQADGVQVELADGRSLPAQQVVLACGAWSKPLAQALGDTVPLDTERGYNTTLPPQGFALQRQLYFNDHAFVVTPLATGIRVGGAVELAGLQLPPNYARANALLAKAEQFLPYLDTRGGTQWMGFRPSLPDSLPVISHASASPRVVYAFGHGHLGLTQSAGTARLVADLVAQRTPSIDLTPFRADRF